MGQALLIASTIFQAYSSIQQGKAEAEAANFERAQYEEQKALAKVQAMDEEADRRRRLEQVLASNRAAAAGMGVGTEGRSFLAIQDDNKAEAERDIGRIRLNAASTNRRYSLASDQAALASRNSLRSGYIGAGTSLLRGGYKYSQIQQE
ncbi:MAG: hypothetical protein AB7G80_09060 [Dongiaceae bacterium]